MSESSRAAPRTVDPNRYRCWIPRSRSSVSCCLSLAIASSVCIGYAPALRALFPAALRFVIFGAPLDPTLALGCFLAFPEWRVGLQPVDQEMAGSERGLAMRRGGRHQHDAVARFQPALAVDDQRIGKRPAPIGFGLDLGELSLGHAGVVFEAQRRDPLRPAHVAHQADKACHPAYTVIAGGKLFEFRADIEILALHPDHRPTLRSPAETARPRRRRAPGGRVR